MKIKFTLILSSISFYCLSLSAQQSAQNTSAVKNLSWSTAWENPKAFIENKGQFDGRNWKTDLTIQYAIDYNGFSMFFNREGFTYRLDKFIRNRNKSGSDSEEAREARKSGKPKWVNISEFVNTTWIGSDKNVEITTLDTTKYYFSYTFRKKDSREYDNENHVKGYKKLIYKNLYPKVDVDYEIHPNKGVKYNITLHPGADPSKVRIKYESYHTNTKSEFIKYSLDPAGNFYIQTSLGEIKELKPYAYYKDSGKEIKAHFKFENDILSFELENYDQNREVVIDPWVVSSTFNSSTAVWEVETDASGNVYVIGGETPMTLQKYSSAGSLIWSHPTPWDTASVWLGTLATDNFGTSFITSGTAPEMQRVDNTGATVWTQSGPSGFSGDAEWWSITFNCDKTKLIVGGTILNLGFDAWATIFDMDINSGNVLDTLKLTHTDLTQFGSMPVEVRSISSSRNAKYIFLTHLDVGAINQNIGVCPTDEPVFQLDNGHNLGYKCENYLPASQNGGGLKAIVANDQFFYTSSGAQIFKRSLSDGTLINTATIPGGANSNDFFGKKVVENSGLAVDSCGNVYAGSKSKVIKFDKDLNILSQTTVSFTVYDVSVNSNGEVVAVGAASDNSAASRNGKIESLALSACPPYYLVCCDANVCPPNPLCVSGSSVTLTPSTSGGTWSGSGVNSSGIFDPAAAGVGTHYIQYSLSCGTDSIAIQVNSCQALTACQESNNDITATSGSGPYTWYKQTITQDCSSCFFSICDNPPGCTQNVTSWTQFATGATVTPGTFPILMIDSNGDSLQIANASQLPSCSPCTPPTTTASSNATTCGQNNGSATASGTGGTTPYTYAWSNGATTATITGLAAGTYTVTITGGTCSSNASVTVASSTGITTTTSSTNASCGTNNGTATVNPSGGTSPYTYSWSNGQTAQTATSVGAGTYYVTVTDFANCTATASVSVVSSSGMTGSATSNSTTCGKNDGTATANQSGGASPYTYLWNNSQTTQTITGLASGTFNVTITDVNGCTVTASASVGSSSGVNLSASATNSSCGSNNGSANATASGGTAPYSYAWSNSSTDSTITGLSPGSYIVTVTDGAGCTDTATATVSSSSGLAATVNTNAASCANNDGSAIASPSGGTSPYTYLWSNGQTTPSITGLASGNYSVTVTDFTNCNFTASATLSSASGPIATASATATTCNGGNDGSVTVVISSGTSPYTFAWSNGDSSQTVSGLAPGSYTVTVTDANGCNANSPATVSEPPAMTVTTSSVDASCGVSDGSATVTVSGGSSPHSYLWDSSAGNQTSPTATGLPAATYNVTATDNNGCQQTAAATVSNAGAPTVSITQTSAQCTGQGNGSASATASGGSTPYTFTWSNGDSGQYADSLAAGTYSLTVTDNTGCIGTALILINIIDPDINGPGVICPNQNATLIATGADSYIWSTGETNDTIVVSPNADSTFYLSISSPFVCNNADSITVVVSPGIDAVVSKDTTIGYGATIQILASGGTYYLWSNGQTTDDITVTLETSTSFIVTVVDEYGCRDIDTIDIKVECRHDISIPTAFSPNNDGINDFIRVHGYGIVELNFVVYDRWGEKVFETTDKTVRWDGTQKGKALNSAVFVYVLDVTFCDENQYREKGNITLVR